MGGLGRETEQEHKEIENVHIALRGSNFHFSKEKKNRKATVGFPHKTGSSALIPCGSVLNTGPAAEP